MRMLYVNSIQYRQDEELGMCNIWVPLIVGILSSSGFIDAIQGHNVETDCLVFCMWFYSLHIVSLNCVDEATG